MEDYLSAVKDVLIVVVPIVVAWISYLSNKKSQRDIQIEVERVTKEKEAETKQILDKIGAELESQKQLINWQNTIPQTNEYTKLIGIERFSVVAALPKLCQDIKALLRSDLSIEMLQDLKEMLDRIKLPEEHEKLYPHEVPPLFEYGLVNKEIKKILEEKSGNPI